MFILSHIKELIKCVRKTENSDVHSKSRFNCHSGLYISNLTEAVPYKTLGRGLLLFVNDLVLPDGPGNSVGIVTGYELDGPGMNPGGGEIFQTCPDRPWGPPSLLYNGFWVFLEGRGGRGVGLTPDPHLVPRY